MQATKWLLMEIELKKVSQTLEGLTQRLQEIENNKDQEILALVEVLANATFFGQMKKALCQHAKDGQCSLYVVDSSSPGQIPFTDSCRIKECREQSKHSHIELSNITCGLCHETATGEDFERDFAKPDLSNNGDR